MTKRILALLLAVVFCLTLFGCKPKNEEPTGTSGTSQTDAGATTGDTTGDTSDQTGTTDGQDTTGESKSDYENWGAGEVGL